MGVHVTSLYDHGDAN